MNYLLVIEVNQMTYKNIVKVDQAELNVYIDGERAGNTPLYTVTGDYNINPYSVMVLGRPYSEQE